MKRFYLFIQYLKNVRIKEYENIIKKAKEHNYEITSLRDYIENNYDKSKKLLILRHDIDHLSLGTRLMFEVEKKHQVKASFYFRNSTFEPQIMKEIEDYGSESSLHFEAIADFVKANPHIKNKEKLFQSNFKEPCLKILKANLERFRYLLDIPCHTIASHGEYENVLVQTANNYLTEDSDTYAFLGIKLEAYNKDFIERVSIYISDVPIEINDGYRYGTNPLLAIENNEKLILFLTHPNHWHYNKWKQFKKLVKMIIKKPIRIEEGFKRI